MEDLEYYENLYNRYKARIASKQTEKAQYLATAEEITVIYNRMSEDKKTLREYRKGVKSFRNESYDDFKGNLKNEYKAKMDVLLDDYAVVISNLDDNMDRLNTVRAQYENKAYQCDGVIGSLRASMNSVAHTIQNWVN